MTERNEYDQAVHNILLAVKAKVIQDSKFIHKCGLGEDVQILETIHLIQKIESHEAQSQLALIKMEQDRIIEQQFAEKIMRGIPDGDSD